MENFILWIDDDQDYTYSVFQPLIDEGYKFDRAQNIYEAYSLLINNYGKYCLIISDLLIPVFPRGHKQLPKLLDEYLVLDSIPGIALIRWIKEEGKVKCPILIYSIIEDPEKRFDLRHYNLIFSIAKLQYTRSDIIKKTKEIICGYEQK